jgi:hypothetical protein
MTRDRKIQLLLWAYFWLLIFEGALRKWIVPDFSDPLLLARDPICMAAIVLGWPYLIYGFNQICIVTLYAIAGMAIVFSMLFGHKDWVTALFGARIIMLHFPLLLLFGTVFATEDAWKFAKALLLLSIPMTILIAFQFSLPQEHYINIAPGGMGSAGFGGALDKFRPPGTFSFINGLSNFYGITAAAFAAWITSGPKPLPKWIWLSGAALVFALPLSISRTLLFNYALVTLTAILACLMAGKVMRYFLLGFAMIGVIAIILSESSLFNEASEAFFARWQEATDFEGGQRGVIGVLDSRVIGVFKDGIDLAGSSPLLGQGIGMGTNVGAMRLSGSVDFLITESEWGLVMGELGGLVGSLYLSFRIIISFCLIFSGIKEAFIGNTFPLILSGFVVPSLVIGQTSQPTSLGFIIFSAGLMYASCNTTKGWLLNSAASDSFHKVSESSLKTQ